MINKKMITMTILILTTILITGCNDTYIIKKTYNTNIESNSTVGSGNFTYSDYFDQELNSTSNVIFNSISGNIDYLYIQDAPWLTSYTETDPIWNSEKSLYMTLLDQRYNDTVLINTKLDITDQRYNDTSYINTQLSGYYTKQQTNDTIDAKLSQQTHTHLPFNISTLYGNITTGNISSILSQDGLTYNVSENTTTPGIEVRINFTNVTNFNNVFIYAYYEGSPFHNMLIKFYNYNTTTWDSVGSFTDEGGFVPTSKYVSNGAYYINNSLVQLSLYHVQVGVGSHDLFIDQIILSQISTGAVSTISGNGDSGFITMWNDGSSLKNSIINQSSSLISVNGNLSVNTLFGNLNASYINNPYWLNITDQRFNDTTLINQKALPGNCGVGQVVQNTTTTGVQCVTPTASITGGNCPTGQVVQNITTSGIPVCVTPTAEASLPSNAQFTTLNVTNGIWLPNSSEPINPGSGAVLFSENRGEHSLMAYVGKEGRDHYMQSSLAYEDVITCQPAHSVAGTSVHTCTAGYVAAIGTVSNPATTYGNVRDSMIWNVLTSAAGLTEHKASGLKWGRGNATLGALGLSNGGFNFVETFYIGGYDVNTVGCWGMTSTTTAYTVANNCFNISTANNIFVGFNKSQTTLGIWTSNATATSLTKVLDCGSPYYNISTLTNVYQVDIFAKRSGGNVSVYLRRLDNTSIPPCTITLNGNDARLPVATTPLGWRSFLGRLGTAGTTGVIQGMNKIYISSDK